MKTIDSTLELDKTPWRLFEPEYDGGREWCVLWLQGFHSNIEGHAEGVARMAEAMRTPFAMLDYAGHGTHPIVLGDASRKQQFDEVLGVYDELMNLGFQKIVVIGGSFGGYMAALLVGQRKAEALVLRAPANYPDDEFELPYRDTAAGRKSEDHRLYREGYDERFVNSAVEAVSNFTGDTFVMEHEKDEVISPAIPRSYFSAARHGNYLIVRGVKHSPKLMPNPEKYFEVIEQWLVTIVKTVKDDRL